MNELENKIESILFVAGRPVKISELSKSLGIPKDDVGEAVKNLSELIKETGIILIQKDEKIQLVSNPKNSKGVGDFISAELREKLTDAAVETLAVIVYKQPVTRAEIEAIRGVNSQYILRQLLMRGLIEKASSQQDARRLVYKTTLEFMSHLGIRDMKDLPEFEELTRAVSLPEQTEKESAAEDKTGSQIEDGEKTIPPQAMENKNPLNIEQTEKADTEDLGDSEDDGF